MLQEPTVLSKYDIKATTISIAIWYLWRYQAVLGVEALMANRRILKCWLCLPWSRHFNYLNVTSSRIFVWVFKNIPQVKCFN